MAFNSAARVKPEVDLYKEITKEEEDVLDFFHSILKIQSRTHRAAAVPFKGSVATLEKRLKNSQRLVKPEEVSIPRREYLRALDEIQDEMERRWIPEKKLKRISKLEELNVKNFPRFMRGMLSGRSSYLKGLPTKTRVRKASLQYALEYAATPFMARLSADVSKKVDLSLWEKGKCPVCGRLPVMARLRKEDGARFLYCGFCTTEWRFPRLTCVYCGNTDQFGMQYFFAEGDSGHRVDVCDRCKRSVRTTDERTLGRETYFEVENWVTSYLNDVAKRRGYKSVG
jgi:FdhE protein